MENNGEEKSYIPNRVVSKEDLKTYFENGDIPNQDQFWAWQDSYWHKTDENDIIPAERVDLSAKADLIEGKVPASQLPSYVDDVIEGYLSSNGLFYSDEINSNLITAETSKIYVSLVTNKIYRWSGSTYIEITQNANTTLTNDLLNNYLPKWNMGTNKFSNSVLQDDGSKVGIGMTPNTTTNSAQLNFKATDRKIMNIPKTPFLSSYLNGLPNQNQQLGDIYNNENNLFWIRGSSNTEKWKKLTGFDVDYICQLPSDFNSLKTTYSDTVTNANYDILDKYGFANIWTSNYCYGQKLTEKFSSIKNADSRMFEGVLTNINTGPFWYNGGVQQYQDIKGNLFLRGVGANSAGYPYSEPDWKKVLTDNQNKTTVIGRILNENGEPTEPVEPNYPSAKFAIDSNTKGFLLPRMTKAQRNAINSPVAGLLIFQTDTTPGLRCYNGTNWIKYSETTD